MIGEIRSGSSFRGLTHYLLHGSAATHPKVPAWVELRNLLARDPEQAHLEMRATAVRNRRVHDPVFHLVLSPAPEDRLAREDWLALADRVLGELGLEEHQALLALHTETGLPHLHLAINRVHPHTLRAWDRWRSQTRVEGVLRKVEQEWNLRRVPGRLAGPERLGVEQPLPPPLSPGEQAQRHHRASEPQVVRWRRALSPHFEEARSWTELEARLHANGVRIEARGRGLVVSDGSVQVKASRIGREYSRARLEARFGGFAEWRRELGRFDAAAALYPRLSARSPVHPRATAAARVLRQSGARLGWRALSRLRGPLPPVVASVALGAQRSARAASRAAAHEEARAWEALVRRQLRPAIERARSWAEAEGRLRLYGAWIGAERPSGRLLVTDGVRATPLEDLWEGSPAAPVSDSLSRRLGPWEAWERSRAELVAAAARYAHAAGEVSSPGLRSGRWRRLGRIIRAAEERLERFEHLGTELRAAEDRLRGLLEGRKRGKATARRRRGTVAETRALLAALRSVPAAEIPELLSKASPGRARLGRAASSRGHGELLEAARDFRALSDRSRLSAPAARSASRRLPQLRLRARLLNPRQQRERAGAALVQAARPFVGLGLGSLLARSAPGLGAAVRLVRLVGRVSRGVARDRDRGR